MKVRRPNGIIYFFVYLFLMPFMKVFFRLEVDRSGYTRPGAPFLVLCNHGSFMDFVIAMLAVYPVRLNAVTAQKYFLFKPLHWFLPMMGCIPKNLFDADVRSIIGIKQVLASGGNVLLFPEGRAQTDGMYAGINTATGKLIKKLQVPVVACSIDGAYGCMPFWRKGIRHGRIRITVSNLFSVEALRELSINEINKGIDRRLSHEDDTPSLRPLGAYSKKRLAEGLDQILYWCPVCSAEFKTRTADRIIRCEACGFSAELDGELNLKVLQDERADTRSAPTEKKEVSMQGQQTNSRGGPCVHPPTTLHEWFKAQVQHERDALTENFEPLNIKVKVRLPSQTPGGGMIECGSGTVRMDTKGWYFDGEIHGKTADLHFPFNMVPAIPFDPDDVFQIYAHGTFYCFVPEYPRASVKYSIIGECAYHKFVSDIRMTPGKAFNL